MGVFDLVDEGVEQDVSLEGNKHGVLSNEHIERVTLASGMVA